MDLSYVKSGKSRYLLELCSCHTTGYNNGLQGSLFQGYLHILSYMKSGVGCMTCFG